VGDKGGLRGTILGNEYFRCVEDPLLGSGEGNSYGAVKNRSHLESGDPSHPGDQSHQLEKDGKGLKEGKKIHADIRRKLKI